MNSARRRGATWALVAAATASALSGCSSDDDSDGRAGDPTSVVEGVDALGTTVQAGKLVGELDRAKHDRVLAKVGDVVDGWIDAAYVGGNYPRSDFDDAFPGFSEGAAEDARGDLDLTTNARLGEQSEAVEALRRRVTIDVLAAHGVAQGATARVVLAYATAGESPQLVKVTGRLFLTYQQGWTVFGYDLSRAARPYDSAEQESTS